MTPEAVIYRYLQLTGARLVDATSLCRLLSADADLLNNWLRVLDLPVDYEQLENQLSRLTSHEFASLAPAQASNMTPTNGTARLGLDQWLAVLKAAFLAEELARVLRPAASAPGAGETDSDIAEAGLRNVRMRVLLGLSGVQLPHDKQLRLLNEFRGTSPLLLEDAQLELRIFAVVDAIETGRDTEFAQSLLGMNELSYVQVRQRSDAAAEAWVGSLGITSDPDIDWSHRIWLRQRIGVVTQAFADCASREEFIAAHELVSRGLFAAPPLLLSYSAITDKITLEDDDEIVISGQSRSSRVAVALRVARVQPIADDNEHAVVDRQLLRRLGVEEAVVVPVGEGDQRGLLVVPNDDDVDIDVAAEIYGEELSKYLGQQLEPELPAVADDIDGLAAMASRDESFELFREAEIERLRELVHEANNPLSIVNNYLHILGIQLQHEPEAQEKLAVISEELKRAEEVFARARNVPQIITPEEDDEPEVPSGPATDEAARTFDLVDWIRQLVELHTGYGQQQGVLVEYSDRRGPVELTCERDKLTQVVTNLIRNAIEACDVGDRVTVTVHDQVYRDGQPGVLIGVEDTGPGLTPEVLSALRDNKVSDKGDEHQGVGLKLCFRLADELGGALDLRTLQYEGTEFALFVPLHRSTESSSPESSSPPPE